MSPLDAAVRAALRSPSRRWYQGLACAVSAPRWERLAAFGLFPELYGTARVLHASSEGPRAGAVAMDAGWHRALPIERFDALMRARYTAIGVEPSDKVCPAAFSQSLADAMQLLDEIPAIGDAVRSLVWSVTPIAVTGKDYDSSYSDPAVPFSIFIGAHEPGARIPAIRLAEGILHEAMHLQLSLIEDLMPLVQGSADRRHSPWQRTPRPTQGLLHGLYVFRVIQDWLGSLILGRHISGEALLHAHKRIEQIEEECAELASLAGSDELTAEGKSLVAALALLA